MPCLAILHAKLLNHSSFSESSHFCFVANILEQLGNLLQSRGTSISPIEGTYCHCSRFLPLATGSVCLLLLETLLFDTMICYQLTGAFPCTIRTSFHMVASRQSGKFRQPFLCAGSYFLTLAHVFSYFSQVLILCYWFQTIWSKSRLKVQDLKHTRLFRQVRIVNHWQLVCQWDSIVTFVFATCRHVDLLQFFLLRYSHYNLRVLQKNTIMRTLTPLSNYLLIYFDSSKTLLKNFVKQKHNVSRRKFAVQG